MYTKMVQSLPPAQAALSERLLAILQKIPSVVLAFSGGLDSRFLAHTLQALNHPALLVHITGPHVPSVETQAACLWAKERGLALVLLQVDPLGVPAVAGNDPARCYHCKTALFKQILAFLHEYPPFEGAGYCLVDGSNASDQAQYRPGMRALVELGIRSPLAEAGLGKEDIRAIGAATGLERPCQPSRPCLLTRFSYGTVATRAVLEQLGMAEEAIGNLLEAENFTKEQDFRLRVLGETSGNYALELHLRSAVESDLAEALCQAVVQAGLPLPKIRVVDKVSGYYDREFHGKLEG